MICFDGKKIHFIGIGGVGVNALARYVLDNGGSVSGSDAKFSAFCKNIRDKGAYVYEGVNASAIDNADAVVYSSAIKSDNAELVRAKERNIPVFERQEFLHEIAREYKTVIGIAGTHGKTTTTAMIAHVLAEHNKKFVAMIGGDSVDFGNYVNNSCGDKDVFLVEACEYKRNFLTLHPSVAVVTNIECDHPDCYSDYASVKEAFDEYLSQAKTKIFLKRDGEKSWEIALQGEDGIDVVCASLKENSCAVCFNKKHVCDFRLSDGGDYNYKNATFAISVAKILGIEINDAAKSLGTFGGVARRFEYAGKINGVPTYFDFAHHPTEIACVLDRAKNYGRILAIFQPHTYSRTKAYFDDFVKVFGAQKQIGTLILMPTYAARETFDGDYESDALADAIKAKFGKLDIYLAADKSSAYGLASKFAKSHDIVLFIGAGDIYDIKAEYCSSDSK